MATAKKSETTALSVTDSFKIMPMGQALSSEDIAEELDGLGTIPFDRVKIPSGGAKTFEIPTEDGDDTESVNDITGVIVYHHAANAYWENEYSGAIEDPLCSSMDGKTGVNRKTGEVINCATCPLNQYGSTQNGGKACKNVHRCYIMRNGNPIPLLLNLPPTSLNSFRNYLGKKVLLKGYKASDIVTKITLKTDSNKGGIKYSKTAFENLGPLSKEEKDKIQAVKESVKSIAQSESIVADDKMQYSEEPAAANEPIKEQLPTPVQASSVQAKAPIPTVSTPSSVQNEIDRYVEFDNIDNNSSGNPFA